jgi:flagellum-specific ATP synthase
MSARTDTVGGRTRLARLAAALSGHRGQLPLLRRGGAVSEVTATHVRVSGLATAVELGSFVEIDTGSGAGRGLGEVIGIQPDAITIKLFSAVPRLGLGTRAWVRDEVTIRPCGQWLGRVVDALGQPIDGKGTLPQGAQSFRVDNDPLPPMAMDRVSTPCPTGVKVIDLFTPICAGQRIGIFAGSGVGKSTLLAMLARAEGFTAVVIALVAERGREVREFIEDVVAPTGIHAVTVVATSSESAMMRKLSARTAMTIAESFRDAGERVLIIVDSITRYAHALREVALAAGEPPVARGYAPSVFAELPRLLERAGPGRPSAGSITGIFSVLVDGDDHSDPVADTIRGILDGHIVLDRTIADQGRYPAVDPLKSISRLARHAWTKEEAELVRRLRALIARFEETRELRALGAYKPGGDAELDQAVTLTPIVYRVLQQLPGDPPCTSAFGELRATLEQGMAKEPGDTPARRASART